MYITIRYHFFHKRLFLFLGLLSILFSPAYAQKKKEISLRDSLSWSMIIVPDLQSYTKFDHNQPIAELMMQWIKQHTQDLNIQLVLCTGDLVEQNNLPHADGVNGNQNSQQQWEAVSNALGILDQSIPYIVCTGNHDHGIRKAENRYSQLNSYFSSSRKSLYTHLLKGMFANESGVETLENAWYEFISPQGDKYLIVSLEFNPRKEVVEQAHKLVNRDEYKDHRIIYLTHSYMNSKGVRFKKEDYYKVKNVTCGDELWERLIKPTQNPSLVVCGHVVDDFTPRGQVGFRSDKNTSGKTVHQMMFNAQALGGGWHGNGGDGWLRILEFSPDGTVWVRTYSPLFGISPSTQPFAERTEPYDQFSFVIE